MELFKLFGTIAVKNEEANRDIDETTNKAEQSEGRISGAFKKIGKSIVDAFSKNKNIKDTESNLNELTKTINSQEGDLSKLKSKYSDLYLTQGKNSDEAKKTAQEIDKLSKELKENKSALSEAEKAADSFDNSLEDVGDSAGNSGGRIIDTFKKIGGAVVTYLAVDKIVEFGKSITNAAAEVAAEQSAFEQIMGDYSNTAQEKVNEIADATGMVSTRLTPYMTSMTAKFKGLGFDIDDATTLAQDGLTLAADAAAFWDKSLEDSMSGLNSFINGSYEGGEAIGLFANDTQLASYAVKNGIVSETKEWANLDEAKKQATRLKYAQDMMKASGATGQAAKEADQYANVQENMNEQWRQFKAVIGTPLLQGLIPIFKGITDALSGVTEKLKNSSNLFEGFSSIISDIVAKAQEKIPEFVALAGQMMTKFGESIKANLPTLTTKALDMIEGFVDMIAQNLPLLIQAGVDMLQNIAQGIANTLPTLIERVPTIVSKIANLINDNAPTILAAGVNIIKTLAMGLVNAIPTLVANIPQILQAIWDAFQAFNWINLGKQLVGGIKNGITEAGEGLKQNVKNLLENINNTIKNMFTKAKDLAVSIWNALKTGVSNIVSGLKNFIGNIWNGIKTLTSSVFNGVKAIASSIWNGIKSAISGVVNGVKSVVTSVWNGIKNTTSSVFNGIKSTATSVWNGIKSAIQTPINAAKDAVKSAIDKMKSFFNFSWSLPKLKLPHIRISGKFSINPPSVPKFGIEWYKKGGIMEDPTLFGINQITGRAMVGGEAGPEAIAPIDKLQDYIMAAVRAENGEVSERIDRLIRILEKYFPMILELIASGKDIYLDSGELVGALGGKMDAELGDIAALRRRGQ